MNLEIFFKKLHSNFLNHKHSTNNAGWKFVQSHRDGEVKEHRSTTLCFIKKKLVPFGYPQHCN